HLDTPGALNPPVDPYAMSPAKNAQAPAQGLAESEEALNRRAAGSAQLPRGTPVASEPLEATASARPAAPGEAAASSSAPPCATRSDTAAASTASEKVVRFVRRVKTADRETSVIRIPLYDQVTTDPILYAHAS